MCVLPLSICGEVAKFCFVVSATTSTTPFLFLLLIPLFLRHPVKVVVTFAFGVAHF